MDCGLSLRNRLWFRLSACAIRAALTVEGPNNGPLFRAWVEQHMVPVLINVVMDNLYSNKGAGAGAALRYLPPYSPDLNPIELAFAKLKKLLRAGAERTVDNLWHLCGRQLVGLVFLDLDNLLTIPEFRHDCVIQFGLSDVYSSVVSVMWTDI